MRIHFNGASIKFEPRDLWVGVYWESGVQLQENNGDIERWRSLSLYLCIIPMFPICIRTSWMEAAIDFTEINRMLRDLDQDYIVTERAKKMQGRKK